MKRVLAIGFIVAYLGVLTYGNLCHTLRFATSNHPLMYMIVWDMFCGWSAFDSRVHIIAEGESETYYDLTHPPWGELHPYGYIGRENYDQFQNHTGMMGLNVLKHTQHEPITRLFVIEECWAKKFNLPDSVWKLRYDDPKDIQRYYRRRLALLPNGKVLQANSSWVAFQGGEMMIDNPRLVQQSKQSQSLFVLDSSISQGREVMADSETGTGGLPARILPVSAESGN